MFIDILNIINRTFSGMSYGLAGSLLGTLLFSDFKKDMENQMALRFGPLNKGNIYGYIFGFIIGYRLTKKIEYSY